MRITLLGSSRRTQVRLLADPYETGSLVDLIGEARNLDVQSPQPEQPPIVPPDDPPIQPPTPNNPTQFDHLTLPRLPVQPSQILNANVPKTVLIAGENLDLSDAFLSGDWNQPISGEARGSIRLGDVLSDTGDRLLLQAEKLKVGDRITWVQIFGDNLQKVICNAFLLNKPVIEQTDDSYEINLEIGCRLALLSKRQWLRDIPYCGKPPKNVRQAVRIFEALIKTPILATQGHDLVVPPENFSSESPYDFLQGLYAPTDQDVRCNLDGYIQIFPRPKYQPNNNLTAYIPTNTPIPDSTLLFTHLKLTNTFTKVNQLTRRIETFTELSPTYDVNNTKPWYLNGSWRKVTRIEFLGDTEVYRKEELYARFPNAVTYSPPSTASAVTVTIVPESAIDSTCESGVSVYSTTERLISVTEFALRTRRHRSGALLVIGKTQQTYGWATISGEGETGFYNGMISKEIERLDNVPIPNESACRKDWQFVTNLRVFSRYERHPLSNQIILVSREVDAYRDVTKENDLGNGLSRTVPKTWVSVNLRGAFTDGYWVEQPAKKGNEPPPESQWVRPTTTEITVSGIASNPAIERSIGFKPASPSDAPHCFRPIQCQRLAARQIRDSYAIANSREIIVPYYQNFSLGQSVDLPDLGYRGQVYGITYKQDLSNAEQTLTLGKIEI